MAIQERRTKAVYKYYYPYACSGTAYQYSGEFDLSYESVESYRGRLVFATVGSKRKKAFHPFTRYMYAFTGVSVFRWCPVPRGTRTLASWYFPHVNIAYCMAMSPDDPGNPYKGQWPIIGRPRMEILIAEKHLENCSDLFVKACEPRFDGLVFVAELDETLVGIKDLLKGAIKALGTTSVTANIVLNPQDLWLWYRYALMPAILSTNDLLEAFRSRAKIDRIQCGNRGKTTLTYGTLLHPGWDMGTGSLITQEIPWTSETTVGRGGALDFCYRIDPNEWGFGGVDLFRALYERIPFSFIFDWFVKLGDWLTTMRNVQFELAQSYSAVAVQTVTKFHAGKDCTYSGDTPELKCFLQKRYTDLEPPKLPLIDKDWRNLVRTIDSIALLIGFLKGILQKSKR